MTCPCDVDTCVECDGRVDDWGRCVDCGLDNSEELEAIETFEILR